MTEEDVKGLSSNEKIEYDNWKKENTIQGTTYEEMKKNTDENTKALLSSFTDSKGNFKKMKSTNNSRYKKPLNNKKSAIELAFNQ